MFNPLKYFTNAIERAYEKFLSWVSNPESRRKAIEALRIANDLAEYAVRAVKLVSPLAKALASATPTPVDDAIVAVVERTGRKVEEFWLETDDDKRKGMLRGLARELAKDLLIAQVAAGGDVRVGGIRLGTVEDVLEIADHLFNKAIEDAFAVLKNGNEI
jgi:hypothetical protein